MTQIIISSKYQTKQWRKDQVWYINGKKNECEKFQRLEIEKIINIKCNKTKERIDMRTYEIKEKINPLTEPDGFEYTEDFDGVVQLKDKKFYFNLKFVCENGGSQTRTLREVYHFIKCIIQCLKKQKVKTYFVNILDGKFCFLHQDKYRYLLELFKDDIDIIKKYIFIGDLLTFQKWWNENN